MKKDLFHILFFSMFLYAYMAVLSVTDSYASMLPGLKLNLILHYIPAAARILGYISFTAGRRLFKEERERRLLLLAAGMMFFLTAAVLILLSGHNRQAIPAGMLTVLLLALSFSAGHLGGLVYYVMASALVMHKARGRIIGVACSIAVLVQYFVAGRLGNTAQLLAVTVIFFVVSYLAIKPPADYVLEDPLPYAEYSGEFCRGVHRQLMLTALVLLLTSLMACRIDIFFSTQSFSGNMNIYSFPRLFLIPGYLIMGIAADIRDRRVFPAVYFSGMLISSVLMAIPFADGDYLFFLSAYYMFIGFFVFFYTYSFISLAPRTRCPELWASFGRPLSDLVSGVIIATIMNTGLAGLDPIVCLVINFVLLAVMSLVISLGGIDPALAPALQAQLKAEGHSGEDDASDKVPADMLTEKSLSETITDGIKSDEASSDRLADFCEGLLLTPRERDVAAYLIEGSLTMKAIASELGISERSVYRYSSSIYSKASVAGRNELLRLYMNK
ncbi:MAG: hypothetical protein IJT24_02820 [Lachnospiraceae bacterium]|nr:hypothetical protein [Lachnospiraceae bacterium]